MPYSGATICLNGHIVSKAQANSQKYCSVCGKETFSRCLNCRASLRGLWETPGVIVVGPRNYTKPFYCYECGAPYPWTQNILDNAVELLSLDDDLDEISKDLIKTAIPELITDTPTTPIAVAKYRKGVSKAVSFIGESLRQLLVDVVSETAKKALFP